MSKVKKQEKIEIRDEYQDLRDRWSDVKYHNQRYLKDSEITISGGTFAELLNATSGYAKAMTDTKKLLIDVVKYYQEIEVNISKIQIKIVEMHCNNVDAGLTEPIEVKTEEDGDTK